MHRIWHGAREIEPASEWRFRNQFRQAVSQAKLTVTTKVALSAAFADALSKGQVITALIAQGGGNVIAQGGGNVIAAGGGNVIAQGGGNLIAQGGGNLIAQGGGNLIAQGGGNLIAAGGGI